MKTVAAIILVGLTLGACATQSGLHAAGKPTGQQDAMFEKLTTLDGTWEMKGENGKSQVATVFKTSSAHSVVREIMFPGGQDEMTNVYHLDGPSVMVTHYCAMGNQPRMRATTMENNAITFNFDNITNMSGPNQGYMGQLTIAFKDKDHIVETWQDMKNGKPAGKPTVFDLTRAKS